MAASTITRDTWTNDTGTAAAPNADGTVINNVALQNNIYARIDELFAGAGSYATLTLGGKLAIEGTGTALNVSGGVAGANEIAVRNTTAGTGNYSALKLGNDSVANAAFLQQTTTSFTATGSQPQDGLALRSTRVGGLALAAENASGTVRLYAGGTTERARLFASGGFSFFDTTDPGVNVLRVAGAQTITGLLTVTGGQIAFPAAQVSSADANTLDDYEEGNWTPVIGGAGGTSGQTYNASTYGRYIKVGKLVHVQAYVLFTAKGTITGAVQLQGLPFTSAISGSQYAAFHVEWFSLATSWIYISAEVQPNTTTATLFGTTAAAVSLGGLVTADIGNATQIIITGTYISDN